MTQRTTRTFEATASLAFVESTDPAIPTARLRDGHAECPRCGARLLLRLRAWRAETAPPTGEEYAIHFTQEHILPAIRYEEQAT